MHEYLEMFLEMFQGLEEHCSSPDPRGAIENVQSCFSVVYIHPLGFPSIWTAGGAGSGGCRGWGQLWVL